MTKREFYKAILEMDNVTAEMKDFVGYEIEKMNAKNNAAKEETKRENELAQAEIESFFQSKAGGFYYTASDIANGTENVSLMKASSILKKMVEEGKAKKMPIETPKGYRTGYSLT